MKGHVSLRKPQRYNPEGLSSPAQRSVHAGTQETKFLSVTMRTTKSLLTLAVMLGGVSAAVNHSQAQDWTLTSAPITNWSCVASSADGSNLVAAVNTGPIYLSTDAGATWTAASAPGAGSSGRNTAWSIPCGTTWTPPRGA